MEQFYSETLSKFETKINGMEIETEDPLKRMEAFIPVVMQTFSS